MNFWLYIPAFAALLAGAYIFVACPFLRRFQKAMGFTLLFEGLTSLLGMALLYRTATFFLPVYLLYLVMLLVTPAFYYLAVRPLLREERIHSRNLWIFQTAVIFLAIYLPVVLGTLPEDREVFFRLMQGHPEIASTGASVLLTLDRTAYALYLVEYLFIQFFSIIYVSNYLKSLENYYSDIDARTLIPVISILSLMGLRLIILGVSGFISRSVLPSWLPVMQAVVSVLFYAVAALSVCRVRNTAEELGKMTQQQAERMRTPVANDVIQSRLGKLVEEKFYLERNVNLLDLATRIGVNSKYVSDYLRYHYGETFLSFVNRLRVEESKRLLQKENLSMEEISDKAGYSNVSTFYRNFTKVTGMSPSKFRESAI